MGQMNKMRPRSAGAFGYVGQRPLQEDEATMNLDRGIFVIADGFGGTPAGPEAAKLACESMRRFLEKEAGDLEATLPFVLRKYYSLAGNIVFNSVLFANARLMRANENKNVHERGGASVLGAFLDGDFLALASAGTCSAWLYRDEACAPISVPRSYSKVIEPQHMDARPGLDIPLMSLGVTRDLEPEIVEARVKPGDWILLQTDGVNEKIRREIGALRLTSPSDPSDAIRTLIEGENTADNRLAMVLVF